MSCGFVGSWSWTGRKVGYRSVLTPPVLSYRNGLRNRKAVVSMALMETGSSAVATLASFEDFFSKMSGTWNSERTYHYMGEKPDVERSQTSFEVKKLDSAQKQQVLEENQKQVTTEGLDQCQGFQVSFQTRMEKRGFVTSFTNLVFVPQKEVDGVISGLYMRDYGYEERVPMIATFDFDGREAKLTMRTRYSKVISVDTIKLVNPNCRVRQILNYARPEKDEDPLTEVVLAGFGMETKSTGSRLVGSIPS